MLYRLAHIIKEHFSFIWDIIEWINAVIFKVLHHTRLKELDKILKNINNDYIFRMATIEDVDRLVLFFKEQPQNMFNFFNPHNFDYNSIDRIIRNPAFLTFVVVKPADDSFDDKIVGYFFLRCYINGKCFRGKIVHKDWQGRGIAKAMGNAMTRIALYLGMKMFGSISPENYASLASAKAANTIKVHKILDNGYYYIEFLPKQ